MLVGNLIYSVDYGDKQKNQVQPKARSYNSLDTSAAKGGTQIPPKVSSHKKRVIKVVAIILSVILCLLMVNVIISNISTAKYRNYLANKYSFSSLDLILTYYSGSHEMHESTEGAPYTRYIPAKAIFHRITKNESITVIDNKGYISDDYQIRDISDIAAKYFSDTSGQNVKFVEFNGTESGGKDSKYEFALSDYIQSENNSLVSDSNIKEFLTDFLSPGRGNGLSIFAKISPEKNRDVAELDIVKVFSTLMSKNSYPSIDLLSYSNDAGLQISPTVSGTSSDNTDYTFYYVTSRLNMNQG